jgi:hypothetical protein
VKSEAVNMKTYKKIQKLYGVANVWRRFDVSPPAGFLDTFFAAIVALVMSCAPCQAESHQVRRIALNAAEGVKLVNVKAESTVFHGRDALRVTDAAPAGTGDEGRLVILEKSGFTDGTIELELAGETLPTADESARGFVGLAFRVAADAGRFECFYLRPKNGRSEDQIRRNHSLQYISVPGFPWQRLRKESPEKYESYVDIVPGEWTKLRIEVRGDRARLFVNGSPQPALIVNDLKQGQGSGAISLWIGPGTVAHFANLQVSK